VRDLEHAAFARNGFQSGLAAAIGDVLTKNDDARVARHFVLQGTVDRRHHRVRLALDLRLRIERLGRGIDVGRIDVERRRVGRRLRSGDRLLHRNGHLTFDFAHDCLEIRFGREVLRGDQRGQPDDRIARSFSRPLVRRLVQLLVVRQGM
jgi:hypothetical protein